METSTENKLIHIAHVQRDEKGVSTLYLRKKDPHTYVWNEVYPDDREVETNVFSDTVEEAMRLAQKTWSDRFFQTLACGFRYSLPERDEHGINALFYQMIASLSTSNGVYFDEEAGHNCYVQNASILARDLWQKLTKAGKL